MALLSIVRWQNLAVLVWAQYMAAVFVFNPAEQFLQTLSDPYLHVLVLSGLLCIAGGYMVNSFYDAEKDLINRPNQTAFERLLERPLLLQLYLLVNFLSVVLAAFISTRAVLFYAFYGLLLWLYSHKIKKVTLLGNLAAAGMAIAPFFVLFVYYKEYPLVVFSFLLSIFCFLVARELIKDAEGWKGDAILGYPTVPVRLGMITWWWSLSFFNGLGLALVWWVWHKGQLLFTAFPIVISLLVLALQVVGVRAQKKEEFARMHTGYKFLLMILIAGLAGFVTYRL